MIVSKSFSGAGASNTAAKFIRGTAVAEGSAGVTTAEDATFTDNTADAFDDAVVGDVIHISGEGSYTIVTKTDANNVELSGLLTSTDTDVSWKITRNGVDPDDIIYVGPNGHNSARWDMVYDSKTFSV